jgi:NADPH-dependent ferric siderophore reductase
MTTPEPEREPAPVRIRREPPRFRRVEVQRVVPLSARMLRITLGGPDLAGFTVEEPAASVRLLIPSTPGAPLVMPEWRGNEFLLPDGRRPVIRTFTPRRVDTDPPELDIDAVLHGDGAASQWAAAAEAGFDAAVSGPGRGYTVDERAGDFLLAGDETAIPAISQLLEQLPATAKVTTLIEVAEPDARLTLPHHPQARTSWFDLPGGAPPGDALVAAVAAETITPDTRVWAAGEAAAVQRIRKFLFDERKVPRARTTIRGYWKHGRAGTGDD